jgi:hypothetical protein
LRVWCAPVSSVRPVYSGSVGFTTGVARPRCTCSSEVRYSAAPRNWYWPVEQSCSCARCKISVQGCAESLCLSAAQVLRGGCVGCARKPRSPLNGQRCNDMSQLICGVWRCRLRARCAPISSVRPVYGVAHCWGPARPRCARSRGVCPSAAPRNWDWPVQTCACARCEISV